MLEKARGLTTRRDWLISEATKPNFIIGKGPEIARTFSGVLKQEVVIAREQTQLYNPPKGSTINLPSNLDSEVEGHARNAWDKLTGYYQDPKRFIVITANSEATPHTWVKFDTNLPDLQLGLATIQCLNIDSIHLPLRMRLLSGQAVSIAEKPDLPARFFTDLCTVLAGALGAIGDTKEERDDFRSEVIRGRAYDQETEVLPLQLLNQDPTQFCQLFDRKTMSVQPDRLMKPSEVAEWNKMAQDVLRQGRDGHQVIVGSPGYGSYRRLGARFSLTAGVILESVGLDSEKKDTQIASVSMPVQVTADGKDVGWSICTSTEYRSLGEMHARFHHGESELVDYRRWKKRQQA